MHIKPIKTEADYNDALRIVSPYFDQEPLAGTTQADHFEIMVTLIQAYEAKHHAIAPPDPIEAIKFRMEQAGLLSQSPGRSQD